MRAISGERTRRTIIEATTSSRASFSFTLLRAISRGDADMVFLPGKVRNYGPLLYAPIPAHTPRSPSMNNLAALAGRILIALIFLLSGIDKIVHYAPTLGYMTKAGLPFPQVLLVASVIVEIVAALAIITGWKTRWAAGALILWMIPVTWVFHNPSGGQEQMVHFMKNLTITGGLLVLWALGPGGLSLKRSG
ncbi:MAG TPA: DoxX family protein [Burkholderiales bacterium]